MRCWLLMCALLGAEAMAADVLAEAVERFRARDGYRVTLRSQAADGERQVIGYAYRAPGWIRMDFVEPHRGAVMVYDPFARSVRLWPFGTALPSLALAPDNPLIRSPRGHSVDRSDVGALLANLVRLRARGAMAEPVEAELAGRAALVIEVAGASGAEVDGVHRYRVWLARGELFPLKVQSFGADGALIESVDMSDAELDVAFPADFFAP